MYARSAMHKLVEPGKPVRHMRNNYTVTVNEDEEGDREHLEGEVQESRPGERKKLEKK
jgi:hypothetical protein